MENNSEEFSEIVIDFDRSDRLDESFLRMFGFGIKMILKRMFGGNAYPVTVKGSKADVSTFAKTLAAEKSYMNSWMKHGLDNPKTYKDKSKLNRAVKDFTRKTGIKWPFK